MGRHSPPSAHNRTPHVASDTTPVAPVLTRAQTRSLARVRAKRVRLRRLSVIPVACAVLSTYFVNDAYHLIAPAASATERNATVAGPNDLSALAATSWTATAASQSGDGFRVSRERRTPDPLGESSSVLPARAVMPAIDPARTVPGTWVRPSAGDISTCFCMRWGVFHEGIDLAGPLGSPIRSVGDGVVLESGPAAGFGHWIVIQQSNGDVTIYGHMFTELVKVGQHVTAGQHIADIGDDGEATGPHLHFGVRQGGMTGPYVDPVPWLRARGVVVGS